MASAVRRNGFNSVFDAIVCLDGSTRAADALAPARALAARHGEEISLLVLEPDAVKERRRLAEQLAAADVDQGSIVTTNTKADFLRKLQHAAAAGSTPVLSAFGRWNSTGRLFGTLGSLVRADVPRVVAIGPKTTPVRPEGTQTEAKACLVVAADGVRSIEPLIMAAEGCIDEDTSKVVVANVVAPSDPGISYSTRRDAHKFKAHIDVPIETAAITGTDVGAAIAELARREHASLIIARSWHRWHAEEPPTASNSLAIVAEAPCPVLIVN